MSHPSRGAWIEIIVIQMGRVIGLRSHPSRGAWIEIPQGFNSGAETLRRTPRGVRGLKYLCYCIRLYACYVAPLAGCVD